MTISYCIAFLILIMGGVSLVVYKNKKLNTIKNKAHDLHHDINASLVILKLTLDSLRDIALEVRNDASTEHAELTSLVNVLEEGIRELEGSFKRWNGNSH